MLLLILILCVHSAVSTICFPSEAVQASSDAPLPFVVENIQQWTLPTQYATMTVVSELSTNNISAYYAYRVCVAKCFISSLCVGFQVQAISPNVTCALYFGIGTSMTNGVVYRRCQNCLASIELTCPVGISSDDISIPQLYLLGADYRSYDFLAPKSTVNSAQFPKIKIVVYVKQMFALHGPITSLTSSTFSESQDTDTDILIIYTSIQVLLVLFLVSAFALSKNVRS